MPVEDLRANGMMAHLLDSLEAGKDIGHYGRLVFAMIARHFMTEDEVIEHLKKDKDFSEEQARLMFTQVQGKDYSPPRREKVLEFQKQQDFPICPNPEDPDACNVYKDLQFPDEVYEHIQQYVQQKTENHG